MPVPNLSTSLCGPLYNLEKSILEQEDKIEEWFRKEWLKTPPPFYASVDLRNSGYKVAPVDTNLFPAGFNNLNKDFQKRCIKAITEQINSICEHNKSILIIPENHTRNIYYLENLFSLSKFIKSAGFEVRIGTLIEDITSSFKIDLPSGGKLILEPLLKIDGIIQTKDFIPCAILLNNDLSAGIPNILKDVRQKLIPPLELGWINRQKSDHFSLYSEVSNEFSKLFSIDNWDLNPLYDIQMVDFLSKEGIDELSNKVDQLLNEIAIIYKKKNINRQPFVIIKSNQGTYGMSIMSVTSGAEVLNMNRKQRNKMSSSKEGLGVQTVLIQEGVYTNEIVNDYIAEPVVYMIDKYVVGGFYRVHTKKGDMENLNSPGMHFVPLSFEKNCNHPNLEKKLDAPVNRFYTYGVISRLALLAAAREIDYVLKVKND